MNSIDDPDFSDEELSSSTPIQPISVQNQEQAEKNEQSNECNQIQKTKKEVNDIFETDNFLQDLDKNPDVKQHNNEKESLYTSQKVGRGAIRKQVINSKKIQSNKLESETIELPIEQSHSWYDKLPHGQQSKQLNNSKINRNQENDNAMYYLPPRNDQENDMLRRYYQENLENSLTKKQYQQNNIENAIGNRELFCERFVETQKKGNPVYQNKNGNGEFVYCEECNLLSGNYEKNLIDLWTKSNEASQINVQKENDMSTDQQFLYNKFIQNQSKLQPQFTTQNQRNPINQNQANPINQNQENPKSIQTNDDQEVLYLMKVLNNQNIHGQTSQLQEGQMLYVLKVVKPQLLEANNYGVMLTNQAENQKYQNQLVPISPYLREQNIQQTLVPVTQLVKENEDNLNEDKPDQYDATIYNFFDGKKYPLNFGSSENFIIYKLSHNVTKKLSVSIVNLIGMMFDEATMERILSKNSVNPEIIKKKPFPTRQQIIDSLFSLTKSQTNGKFLTQIRFLSKPKISSAKDVSHLERVLNDMLLMSDTFNIIQEYRNDPNYYYRYYENLNIKIRPMDKNCDEFKRIVLYVQNSHGPTHNNYTLEVKEIFKLHKRGQYKSYKLIKDNLKHSKLLWYGTSLTNYPSILSKGFQLRPPQSSNIGNFFGNGIYFTDAVSKAANKCDADKNNPDGILLLAEVCLGKTIKETKSKNVTYLPKPCGGVKGLGKYAPDNKHHFYTASGVQVPLGKLIMDKKLQTNLNYNEYVVYNTKQILLQYLIKVKFHFK